MNWTDESRLTDQPFDYLEAPQANGLFLGDYEGLTADSTDFLAFFQQSSAIDPANGYFRRVEGPVLLTAAGPWRSPGAGAAVPVAAPGPDTGPARYLSYR